uniref:Uncharacterized protein n=1 Tax=Ciona savignyi TaxID=51511 RepID=H2ZHY1_CIOSA
MQETTNELFQGCTSSSAGVDYSIKYNRLESLETFPSSHVNPIQLAKYGFYYTGFEDNVICFSCQNSVRNWKQGDREGDNKWHKPNCAFFNSLSMRPGSSTTVNTISPIPNLNMSFLSESLSSSSQKSSISERNVLPPHSSPSLHSLNEAQLVDISTSTENMNVIHSPTQHSVATPIPQQPALNHFVNTNPSEFASYLQRLDLSQERDRSGRLITGLHACAQSTQPSSLVAGFISPGSGTWLSASPATTS